MKRLAPLFALLAALLIAPAVHAGPETEAAQEMLNAYRFERSAGMLKVEERCWTEAKGSRKTAATSALGCARLMVAGGIIDQAMQISEQRGAIAAFDPAVQRVRYFERTRSLGLKDPQAQEVLGQALRAIPLLVQGLSEAGLR